MSRILFLNLPVRDLPRSIEFFTSLGFTFNPQFTDENAACMVINDQCFVMLLVEKFFAGFTRKSIADTTTQTEAIVALSAQSTAEVDDIVDKATAAGAQQAGEPMEQDGMYQRSFDDLDGHHWEVLYMDTSGMN
jgi:uncharacterized protein